jgi:hypothetical protein
MHTNRAHTVVRRSTPHSSAVIHQTAPDNLDISQPNSKRCQKANVERPHIGMVGHTRACNGSSCAYMYSGYAGWTAPSGRLVQ